MNEIINSPNVITEKPGWMVFLAGPMKASPRGWRNKLVKLAADMGLDGITFLSPRYNTMHQPSNQVEWETQGLRMCDVPLFWIPNKDPKAELGTRIYAETTKMELAENLCPEHTICAYNSFPVIRKSQKCSLSFMIVVNLKYLGLGSAETEALGPEIVIEEIHNFL